MCSVISLRYPGTSHAALCTGLLMCQPSCTMPARNATASVCTPAAVCGAKATQPVSHSTFLAFVSPPLVQNTRVSDMLKAGSLHALQHATSAETCTAA